MGVQQDINRIANAQEEMAVDLRRAITLLENHDRTLYGIDGEREAGISYRVRDLETVNKERDKKKLHAALTIAGVSLTAGGIGAKFETLAAKLSQLFGGS